MAGNPRLDPTNQVIPGTCVRVAIAVACFVGIT